LDDDVVGRANRRQDRGHDRHRQLTELGQTRGPRREAESLEDLHHSSLPREHEGEDDGVDQKALQLGAITVRIGPKLTEPRPTVPGIRDDPLERLRDRDAFLLGSLCGVYVLDRGQLERRAGNLEWCAEITGEAERGLARQAVVERLEVLPDLVGPPNGL